MKLHRDRQYSRKNSFLIENGVEIVKFLQGFPVDIEKFNEGDIKYHEKYITDNPDLVEWLIEEDEMLEYYRDDFEKVIVEKEIVVSKSQEGVESFDPTWSRKRQVQFYLDRGIEKSSEIAEKIGANPSYVQRLIKEIKK